MTSIVKSLALEFTGSSAFADDDSDLLRHHVSSSAQADDPDPVILALAGLSRHARDYWMARLAGHDNRREQVHFFSVTIKFFHASTRAVCPAQMTVVQSN